VFAWPEAWVANAQGRTPAARTTYHRINLAELLTVPVSGTAVPVSDTPPTSDDRGESDTGDGGEPDTGISSSRQ
jgi:hypothetical protein